MSNTIEPEVGTLVSASGAEHRNDHREDGFCCCPHCYHSDHYDKVGWDEDEALVVECKKCGEKFAARIEEIKSCASGFIHELS